MPSWSTRIIPNKSESRATCVKKKKCPSRSFKPGRASKHRMNGVAPKRKVTPGWLLQQEGRIHQIRMHRISVTLTVVFSRFLSEDISDGKRK
jgi:hypothetical protein